MLVEITEAMDEFERTGQVILPEAKIYFEDKYYILEYDDGECMSFDQLQYAVEWYYGIE